MAIMSNDKIMIYGNFDADGICASAIMISLLQKLDARVSFYVPSRYSDGFGLNKSVLKAIKDRGFKVLITVDNGMEDKELIRQAKAYGLKVIVIDRHISLGDMPYANAVLNPKECNLAEKYVSSSYLCFRVAQALSGDSSRYFVSLAAIGTIAANRPYIGYNYKLIKLGLKYLNHFRFKQMELLASNPYIYSIDTIKNVIVPKLEAISRSNGPIDMSIPIKILLSEEILSLENYDRILSGYSKKENKIKNNIIDEIIEDFEYKDEKCIFINDRRIEEIESAPLADRLYFMYNVPIFVFVKDYTNDMLIKCIAKSHSSFPLNRLLFKYKEYINIFSGHATSATFYLRKDCLEEFISIIKEEVFKLNARPKGKYIDVIDVNEDELTLESVKELLQKGFGIYKNDTCFRLKKIRKELLHKSFNGYHLSGKLNDHITLVGYKIAGELDKIDSEYIDIIFRPEINEFHNDVGITLHIYFIE
jgi:single-stranded-DNA-specific exonuclease